MTNQNNAVQAAEQGVDAIMEQAQVFASAWAFFGGPFDQGDGKEQAEREGARLRDVVRDALSKLRAPVADERALPPLPKPAILWHSDFTNQTYYGYTADHMRDYGRAALASAPVADERAAFEAKFPMPEQCAWTGKGYSATDYNAWNASKHASRWEGWQARAALASAPVSDSTLPLEKALHELVSKIAPRLDTGDLVQDAARASALLSAIMTSAPVAGEAQPVAAIILKAVDEYGPMLDWTKHWVEYPIGTKFYAAPQASEAVPNLPRGWQLALNLAIDAIENAAPAGQDWPVNWPAILHGLVELRAALSAQPGAQRTGGSDGDQ